MKRPPLQIVAGPETETACCPTAQVTVPLSEILHVLASATQQQRGWIHDFLDEEISVSADLYDILVAYRGLCREAA